MVQAVIWCLGEITGTLIRFAAYCAVLAAAMMGAWMMVMSLFADDYGRPESPREPTTQALWLDRSLVPPLRRSQD